VITSRFLPSKRAMKLNGPATEKQKETLRGMGAHFSDGISQITALKLIDQFKNKPPDVVERLTRSWRRKPPKEPNNGNL